MNEKTLNHLQIPINLPSYAHYIVLNTSYFV